MPKDHDAPPVDDLVGRTIAHFRVTAKLGEGGMGVVYSALDETLRRTVALKVLPPLYGANEERRARFMREARAAAAVTHANVATVYEVGEADGRVFIAMELVEGRTLRATMRERRLSTSEALHVARGIARGIARAHDKGVVHRDLKPDNVMITDDGEIKVLDFGLAKLREETTRAQLEEARTAIAEHTTKDGRVLGTTGYMSPEQALGRPVDHRTDIFAFGVVLYEMVTATHPFVGDSSLEILIASTRDVQVPASKLNPAVSLELERIIERCLAKDPDARFANAGELLRALDALPTSRVSAPLPPSSSAEIDAALAPTRLDEGVRPGLAAARPSPWPRRALALAAAGIAAVAVFYAATRGPGTRAAAPVEAGPATVPITATSAPKTSNAEAAAAFAAAMQATRDGSMSMALSSLRRAVRLDPDFAAAHLELALRRAFHLGLDEQREHVTRAQTLRSALDARGLALLDVAAAMVGGEGADFQEVVRRARSAAERFPSDAEIALVLGEALCTSGSRTEGYAALDRSLALDPQFAASLWTKSIYQSEAGDRDGALASTKKCLEVSPTASSCLRVRADIEDGRGECALLEKDARAMVAVDSRGPRAFEFLAIALAANGAPLPSVEDALRRRASLLGDEPAQRDAALEDEANLAALTGNFTRAAKVTLDALALRGAQSSESAYQRTGFLLSLYEEMGDTARARAAAADYAGRLPAWAGDAPSVARPLVLSARRRAGDLPEREFRTTRDAWLEDARQKYAYKHANLAWLDFYARPARTKDDARDALDALPRFSPLPAYDGLIVYEEAIGRVYLLAGQLDDAVTHLRIASIACKVLKWPLEGLRAHAELAAAFEAKGDTEGACREYTAVLARWDHAEPRSITAERARARRAALRCDARK